MPPFANWLRAGSFASWLREGCLPDIATSLAGVERWLWQYREWLFGKAEEVTDGATGKVLRKGLKREAIEEVIGEAVGVHAAAAGERRGLSAKNFIL